MKKKIKLAFAEFEQEMSVLTRQELLMLQGGSGIDGYCLFYVMEYLSSGAHNLSYYINSYGATYGYGATIPDGSGNIPGVPAGNVGSFIASHFTASSLNPSGGIEYALSQGKEVVADINMGGGVGHAVVITGTDGSGNYTYVDPMNNIIGVISAYDLSYSVLYSIQ